MHRAGLPRWTIMAGCAGKYDLQEMPWAQAADMAKMRASLKQVRQCRCVPYAIAHDQEVL